MSGTRIQADPAVQQALATKGITEKVGVFGQHTVRLGNAEPINLAAIKAPSVPFAGFRRATKTERGQTGALLAGNGALKALARPGGKLDAKVLLAQLKNLETHLDRLGKLGQLADPQNATFQTFAPLLGQLDNADIAAIYQTFNSAEFDLLFTALQAEGQNNPEAGDARACADKLFDLQALVTKEASDRVCRDIAPEDAARLRPLAETYGPLTKNGPALSLPAYQGRAKDISAANLETLVVTSATSATTRERTALEAEKDMQAYKLHGISARDMGDVMRAAPLTINFHASVLFTADSSLLNEPDKLLQNIFHLAAQGITPKGTGYVDMRQSAEALHFPALARHTVLNPDERPVYAALNLRHSPIGSASMRTYGASCFVLKPEVAQRATYTLDDSFYNAPISITPERRAAFYTLLPGLLNKNFDPAIVAELQNPETDRRKALDAFLDNAAARPGATIREFTETEFPIIIAGLPGADHNAKPAEAVALNERNTFLGSLMVQAFADPQAAAPLHVTHDNLEALLPQMGVPTRNSIACALGKKEDVPRVAISGINYIEAQVQGGIQPSKDIAAINLSEYDFDTKDLGAVRQMAAAFSEKTGVPITWITPKQINAEGERYQQLATETRAFASAHESRPVDIAQEAKTVLGDIQGAINLAFPPNPGAAIPEPQILRGAALGKVTEKLYHTFSSFMQTHAERPFDQTPASVVADLVRQTVGPIIDLKTRMHSLAQTLPFANEDQKAAFMNWLLSAGAVNHEEEVTTTHTAATNLANNLAAALTADPPATSRDVAKIFATTTKEALVSIQKMIRDKNLGGDFGADDISSEINRAAFMGIAFLKNLPNGPELLGKLADVMGQPEAQQFENFLLGIRGNTALASAPGRFYLQHVQTMTHCLRDALKTEGISLPQPKSFPADLRYVSQNIRTQLASLNPEFAAAFNDMFPPFPAIAAPANPAALPATDAQRREFLIRHLDGYLAHEQTFDAASAIHGRSHASRAYIFASALGNYLDSIGIPTDKNAVLCAIACHDLGREGNGVDRWEAQSADVAVAKMTADFGSDTLGTAYENDLRGLIDHSRGNKTLESMLVSTADAMDIGRTKDFDVDMLPLLLDSEGKLPKEVRSLALALAKEADILQRLTNPYCQHKETLWKLQGTALELMHNGNVNIESLRDGSAAIKDLVSLAIKNQGTIPAAEFFQGVERHITANPQMFPVLSQYYRPAAA